MARGDVVGVAYHPELEDPPGVARLQLEVKRDSDGNVTEERPGDPVMFSSDSGKWCTVREATDEERRAGLAGAGVMPGEPLEEQPPQVGVEIAPDWVERGVRAKAKAYIDAGHPNVAVQYLADRQGHRFLPVDVVQGIAGELGLKVKDSDVAAALERSGVARPAEG
jgi:hypothetical protein